MRYFLERELERDFGLDLDLDLDLERPEKRDFFGGWRGATAVTGAAGRCRERVWSFGLR